MTSLRSQVEEVCGLKTELYEIPRTGITVLLKEMRGSAAAKVLSALRPHVGGVKAKDVDANEVGSKMAEVVIEHLPLVMSGCIFDPSTKEPLFPGEEGIKALGEMSTNVLLTMWRKVFDMSGLGEDSLDESKTD
jgi:hypothetical protein